MKRIRLIRDCAGFVNMDRLTVPSRRRLAAGRGDRRRAT